MNVIASSGQKRRLVYRTPPARLIWTTATNVMSKQIYVLCDYDALYAAIELKLSGLSQAHVIRVELDRGRWPEDMSLLGTADLIIFAAIPSFNDPMTLLSRSPIGNQLGHTPVLVISERPSRPESADRITYLNFPFDMDDLTYTALAILNQQPEPSGLNARGSY